MTASQMTFKSRKLSAASWWRGLQKSFSRRGDTLELLLPRGWPERRGTVHWRLRDGAGAAPHGQVTELNQIPGVSNMTRVHVWTPPSDSLLTRVTLPTRSRTKIQQALPYALEDQLVGEPEQLHFSYRILEDGSLAVAVTAKERMQAWLAQLNEAGLRPTGFCPALLAIPLEPGTWSATFHGNDIWVRTGMASGFTSAAGSGGVAPPLLEMCLREVQDKPSAPSGLTIIHPPSGFVQDSWASQLKLPLSIQKQDFWTGYHESVPALNLLQGSFAPSHQLQEMLPGLRPAAIMLGIWMVGSLGFNTWEWWSLKNTHEKLRSEMTQVFRSTFPDAQVVQDPALQMQRLHSELQGKSGKTGQADVLPLLGSIAPVIQANPQIILRGIQYGESRLTIDFTLPDFQTMETIKTALAARGISVEVVGANSTPSGIEGRLRLSRTGRAGT
ncbi:MAG: type II secretion system protein GspL [Gammaproteobacteria bacterium]|nr:type II secretion system protein GspL [Gammaproteobacteria bacterium]MDH3370108.1 type II secretion system protein GspL [Gammaproteobacteria bacterium]MDH3405456.1 type II secretion system protein GspL [Gammaproteobacteria bacterium]MDH3563788.1 type II secretion system protein GspL [Gammaproteobacteria bacterium]MDH5486054.1 type II secretion system protein GspL [Gammaproteobacteria bacterium]